MISTIIPNRNMGRTLARCLESIVGQSHPPAEVVILDDCSSDVSVEIARHYCAARPFARLVRYERKAEDWLKSLHDHYPGLKGEYVHALSADDYLLPGFYQAAAHAVDLAPEKPGIVMGNWRVHDDRGALLGSAEGPRLTGITALHTPAGCRVLQDQLTKPRFFEGGPCCLVRKDEALRLREHGFHKLGPWNDSISYSVVAWRAGAVYLNGFYGVFTLARGGFNECVIKDKDLSWRHFEEVRRFLAGQDLPSDLAHALLGKVFRRLRPDQQADALRMYYYTDTPEEMRWALETY